MDRTNLRYHIERAGSNRATAGQLFTSRIMVNCWPGGADDRLEPAALDWLRHWRPQRAAALIRVCSCSTGRCRVCN